MIKNKKEEYVEHPQYGLMLYDNGILIKLTNKKTLDALSKIRCGDALKIKYRYVMKVKKNREFHRSNEKSTLKCDNCQELFNKTTKYKSIEVCFSCAKRLEELDDELKQLRNEFRNTCKHYAGNVWKNFTGV